MPSFNYVALDARGQETTGVIDAASQAEAVAQIRQAGYFPKSITEGGKAPKRKAAAPSASVAKKDIKINLNIPLP